MQAASKSLVDPCNYGLEVPALEQSAVSQPALAQEWYATAVLHPFSPPPSDGQQPTVPFFQLCTAALSFSTMNQVLSIQITGCEYGQWWYAVTPEGTTLSVDEGTTWNDADMGWTFPTSWFGTPAQTPVYAGTSYLNWMQAQLVDWWKTPVVDSNATTWHWFDSGTSTPFRLMFGQPPSNPLMGDPAQLALFQQFSFTYFPSFEVVSQAEFPPAWENVEIPGFTAGSSGIQLFEWNPNFGMTTLMTPVDAASNPLPTRVLYRWAADAEYSGLADRAQSTLMDYGANPQSGLVSETALMFGAAPEGVTPPPHADSSFIIDQHLDGSVTCGPLIVDGVSLGEEPPWWASIPAVDGAVQASIDDNPALCPGELVAVISVLFPPTTEYPQGRFLWTWYSPFPGSDGSHARPVTFMESASSIAEGGTSLALADYFDYQEFAPGTIDPGCFAIPDACLDAAQ